jgi:hypothetical protein
MAGIKTSLCFTTCKVHPRTGMKAQRWSRGIALLFLSPRRKMGVGDQCQTPGVLPPEDPIPIVGGWVGPKAGLNGCGKSRPPQWFDSRTVQPVASRCTDYAISAHASQLLHIKKIGVIISLGSGDGQDMYPEARNVCWTFKRTTVNRTDHYWQQDTDKESWI